LSSLTFDEFAAFFFAREVVPDDEQYGYFLTDLHGETYFESVPSSPEVLVLQSCLYSLVKLRASIRWLRWTKVYGACGA
jgi:hypothetical protein